LEKEEIEQRVIETRNETRENFIVVDVNSNQQYRFGLPGSQIYQNEEEKIIPALRRLSPGWIVVSGSLPPGMKPEILANIATLAKDTDAKLIIDTSGDALHYAVDVGVFLLKPNLGELSKLIGRETVDNEAVDEAAKELISRGKCEMVVVSMGPQGAHLVTKDIAEHIPAPAVKKMSTVGAGDSMVAGMVHALYHGWSLPDVVRMGVACGSAATMNPGTELFKKEDVEKLYLWLSRSKVITF
jgi:6-phosphofructokinase 2